MIKSLPLYVCLHVCEKKKGQDDSLPFPPSRREFLYGVRAGKSANPTPLRSIGFKPVTILTGFVANLVDERDCQGIDLLALSLTTGGPWFVFLQYNN
jgi:hypothetical protein